MVDDSLKERVIVYPTDTVWGIGGNIYSYEIYKKIAEIKQTTLDKPLSLLFTDELMIREYFKFDQDLFSNIILPISSLETTFAIPTHFLIKKLPIWCVFGSEYIFIRYIPNLQVRSICQELNAPIFTTSLNLTGNVPIRDEKEAFSFYKKYVDYGKFFHIENEKMSGNSSSILKLDMNEKWSILRYGKYHKELYEKLINWPT